MFKQKEKAGFAGMYTDTPFVASFECISYGPNGSPPYPTGKARPMVDDSLNEKLFLPAADGISRPEWPEGSRSPKEDFISVYFKKMETDELTLKLWDACRPYLEKAIGARYRWPDGTHYTSNMTVDLLVVRRDHDVYTKNLAPTEYIVLGSLDVVTDLLINLKLK